MSDRRTSLEKLSNQLRISKEDALALCEILRLKPTANSKGFIGWNPLEVRQACENLDTETKSLLQEFRKNLEEYNEAARQEFLLGNPNKFVDATQAAKLLDIIYDKTERFLDKNNVMHHMDGERKLWLKVDVLEIKNRPSRFQALELRKLKYSKHSTRHINNSQLAKIFDVPVELVTVLKKRLNLTGISPLTEATVSVAVNRSDFSNKRLQVLKTEHKVRGSNSNKKEEKFISRYEIAGLLDLTHEEVTVALQYNLFPKDHQNRFIRDEISLISVERLKSDLRKKALNRIDGTVKDYSPIITSIEQVEDSDFKEKILSRVKVTIPSRLVAPKKTTLYMGPTNSGKTYTSLKALFAEYESNPDGIYVYAGPLRMLAFEVYEKMAEAYGKDKVGFLTGEEQINPEAHLLAATVEMTPSQGTSLVLDEAHWIIEPSRGHNWTNLLLGGTYENFHILTAAEAKDTILALMEDSEEIEENLFTRKTPIFYKNDIDVSNIPDRTAVVAFSRKAVYAIAQAIEMATEKKVAVLYGALPLAARKNQIEKFVNGEVDIIVTTDVIGHGINLPVDNVVFAETSKFDGTSKRDLFIWEAAQIAGRAGRFGLSAEGRVFSLTGLEWAEVDRGIVSDAAKAAMGSISTGMVAESAILTPSFGDLAISDPIEFSVALESWQDKAVELFATRPLKESDLKEIKDRLKMVSSVLSLPLTPWSSVKSIPVNNVFDMTGHKITATNQGWQIKANDLWQIVNGPFDVKLETLKVLAGWLQERKGTNAIERLFAISVDGIETIYQNIEELEIAARLVCELKMVNVIFEDETFVLNEELEFAEQNISDEIISILNKGLSESTVGTCIECHMQCSPWFELCAACYAQESRVKA